jgi:hypothetical protein
VDPFSAASLAYLAAFAVGVDTPLLVVYSFRDLVEERGGAGVQVSMQQMQRACRDIRAQRLAQRRRRQLLQADLSPEQAAQVMEFIGKTEDSLGSDEAAAGGDLLVNVLEASMANYFGLIVLQQVS